MKPRRILKHVPEAVLSSWSPSGDDGPEVPRSSLVPLCYIRAARPEGPAWYIGTAPLGTRRALHRLSLACDAAGGDLRITALARDQVLQHAGLSKERTASGRRWDDDTSWHTAGRAIDIDLAAWLAGELTLADLWTIARPLGWVPIITEPDPRRAEAWHFEHRGPWSGLVASRGYQEAALAATLDVGGWRGDRWEWRTVQAQLHRVGIDVGTIDGIVGARTRAGLAFAGLAGDVSAEDAAAALYPLRRRDYPAAIT